MYYAYFRGRDGVKRRIRLYKSPSVFGEEITLGRDAVSLETSTDTNSLLPIRVTTGSVSLLIEDAVDYSALFRAAPYTINVRIDRLNEENADDVKVEFVGYVAPENLSVQWPPVGSVVSLPIVCPLGRLSSVRLKVRDAEFVPVGSILHECLSTVYLPVRSMNRVFFPTDIEHVTAGGDSSDLLRLKVARSLFYEDCETSEGKKETVGATLETVISSICTSFGLTLQTFNGEIVFSSPRAAVYSVRLLQGSIETFYIEMLRYPQGGDVAPYPLRLPGTPSPFLTLDHSTTRIHASRRVSVSVEHTMSDKIIGDFSMQDFDFASLFLYSYEAREELTMAHAYFDARNSSEVHTQAFALTGDNEWEERTVSALVENGNICTRGKHHYDASGNIIERARKVHFFSGSMPVQVFHRLDRPPLTKMPLRSDYTPTILFVTGAPSLVASEIGGKPFTEYLSGACSIDRVAFKHFLGLRLLASFTPNKSVFLSGGALCLSAAASGHLFKSSVGGTHHTQEYLRGFRKLEEETTWRLRFALRVGEYYYTNGHWEEFPSGISPAERRELFVRIPPLAFSPYVSELPLSSEKSNGAFALESVRNDKSRITRVLPAEHPDGLYLPLINEKGEEITLSGELELRVFAIETNKFPYENNNGIHVMDNKVNEIYLSSPELTFVPYESAWRFDRQHPTTETRRIEAAVQGGGMHEEEIAMRLHSAHERSRGSIGTLLDGGEGLEYIRYNGEVTTLEARRLDDMKREYGRSREYQTLTLPIDYDISPLRRVIHDGLTWRVLSVSTDYGAGVKRVLLADEGK